MVKRLTSLSPADGRSSPTPLPDAASHPPIDLLNLTFYRQSVRRFIFSNNIPLTSLVPGETIDLELMHPIVGSPANPCTYAIKDGLLEISSNTTGSPAESAIYVGGVNPYAVYEIDVQKIDLGSSVETDPPQQRQNVEITLDFATADRQTHIQVAAIYPRADAAFEVRLVKDGVIAHTSPLFLGPAPEAPYKLQVQLAGISLNAFYTKGGQTTHLGRIDPATDSFRDHLDLRHRRTALGSTFNVLTTLPPGGGEGGARVVLGGASSYLSAGVGQADVRNITRRDGAPYFDDAGADRNRLWFTFTARGLGTGDGTQGVLSLDPSAADFRFEGTVVFDHGDGLLRNDYASHLFYDDRARAWRAWVCDFGGARRRDGRAGSGLVVAESPRDPRRGFSVMAARALAAGSDIAGFHEDPCGFYDEAARRWRLLTTDMSVGFRAHLFESVAHGDKGWDGPYVPVPGSRPVEHNSTGTLIQKIGAERYALAGSSDGAIFVYSYPSLEEFGTLKMDLPPFTPGKNSRGKSLCLLCCYVISYTLFSFGGYGNFGPSDSETDQERGDLVGEGLGWGRKALSLFQGL
ncbi:hypothetical protein SLS62_003640 [Diatrype stigma]|uniref:Uncharacterized protein n=1 Tax=Diatrype stigma TaxID=117547 RepID=A0AAN9UW14_9PEZI